MTKKEMCERIIKTYNESNEGIGRIFYKIESKYIYYFCIHESENEYDLDNTYQIEKNTLSEFIEDNL